jgi:hypothetical protein
MAGVGIGNQTKCLMTQSKLGLTEESVVGGGDKPPCHLQDGVGRSALDLGRQFLGFGFEFRAQWF